MLAYCGVLCNECEIYKATISDDFDERKNVAQKFTSSEYPLTVENINCLSCSFENEIVFKFCMECEIRKCGVERKIENCGHCKEYPCNLLKKPFEMDEENKLRLDEVRRMRCK